MEHKNKQQSLKELYGEHYHCKICNMYFQDMSGLGRHYVSKKHIKNKLINPTYVELTMDTIVFTPFTCECGIVLLHENRVKHRKSKIHKQNMETVIEVVEEVKQTEIPEGKILCECGSLLSKGTRLIKHMNTKLHKKKVCKDILYDIFDKIDFSLKVSEKNKPIMENKNNQETEFEYEGKTWEIHYDSFINCITEQKYTHQLLENYGRVSGFLLKRWFSNLYDNVDVEDSYEIQFYKIMNKKHLDWYKVYGWSVWRFRIDELDDENTYHTIRFSHTSWFGLESVKEVHVSESDSEEDE